MATTLTNLKHSGAIYRARGIIQCVQKGFVSEEEIAAIRNLLNDRVKIGGRTISAHAIAALDLLGIELYTGKDEAVQQLIQILPFLPLT